MPHFSDKELADRRAAVRAELQRQKLDGLLMFRQESMYYLTGYEGFGYVYFQCLYMSAEEDEFTLLTRTPDRWVAEETSIIKDIRIWLNAEGVNPAMHLRDILDEHGCGGKRLGIETYAYGLTGYNMRLIDTTLEGFCTLVEASDIVTRLRAIKSPAELRYVRRAAELADNAFERAVKVAAPGAFEGKVLAELQAAIFEGGGDAPGNNQIIGSGRRALVFRDTSGMRQLDPVDQLSLEYAGVYRRYHSCMMQTLFVGEASEYQRSTFGVVSDTLQAMSETLAPGRTAGEVDDVHRSMLDAAGFQRYRLNATGYSLGATFQPNWMDWPMLFSGHSAELKPGMVFFLHCLVLNSDLGVAVSLGRTYEVTTRGSECLSRHPLEMIVV